MVPNSLSIECQLIESDKLKQDSHVVSNENVGSFIIKSFINGYAVSTFMYILARNHVLAKSIQL